MHNFWRRSLSSGVYGGNAFLLSSRYFISAVSSLTGKDTGLGSYLARSHSRKRKAMTRS